MGLPRGHREWVIDYNPNPDDERVPLGNTSIFRRGTSGCFPVHS